MLRGRGTSVCGIGALSDGWRIRAGTLGRALELDRVAFGVCDVNGGAQAFRAVALLDGSGGNARGAQMPADGVRIERLDPKTDVIEIVPLKPRRRATRTAQRSIDRHQVHQRSPRAQLHQAKLVLATLDRAAQHRAVEMQHRVQIGDAQHDMVDFADGDHLESAVSFQQILRLDILLFYTAIKTVMSDPVIVLHAIKGRGAAKRIAHRFERDARDAFDDGWGTLTDGAQSDSAPPATQVTFEDAKSALTHNDSPDIYFDYGLNPYRGCEHGCVYCYARPTHSYLGLSPGLDFETRIVAKRNIAAVLARELAAPRYVPRMIALGTVTDPYQPVERELRLTRGVVELLQRCRHPFAVVTKGSGVERDLDLLAPMAQAGLAAVYVTITTLDAHLARILEPRAAAPYRRLRTLRTLAEAGVPVGVSVGPQIPFVN